MKIKDITKENVKEMSNQELNSLHFRIHQLWAQRKYKKQNIDELKRAHIIIMDEMSRRGMKHTEHAMKRMMSKLETYMEGMT